MAYYLKDLPFTEEGKKLKLSDEDRERFRLVYKREGDGWILHDIYEKGGEYGDDCIVVPLESMYRGSVYFREGQVFANAVNTARDESPIGYAISWIAFWKCMYLACVGRAPQNVRCCTDGMMYVYGEGSTFASPEPVDGCNHANGQEEITFGGHVILQCAPALVYEYSEVYIVPICCAHNNQRARNGYMKTAQQTFAVALWFGINLHEYLAQRPLETHEKI